MSGWLERWQPALLNALQATCEKIDNEFAIELEDKDAEINRLSMLAKKVDRLEEENSSLRAELLELRKQHTTVLGSHATPCDEGRCPSPSSSRDSMATSSKTRPPLGELSPNKTAGASRPASEPPCKEISQHGKEYEDLLRRHTIIKEAQAKTLALAKNYRKDRDVWCKYAETLEAKIQKLEQQPVGSNIVGNPASLIGLPGTGKGSGIPTTGSEKEAGTGKRAIIPVIDLTLLCQPELEEPFDENETHEGRGNRSRRTGSIPIALISGDVSGVDDESTEGGTPEECGVLDKLPPNPRHEGLDGRVTIKQEPSSDEPVIVSERYLKRKRVGHDESARIRRIKSEHSSSGPEVTGEVNRFVPRESQDLDYMPYKLATPRKPWTVYVQDNQHDEKSMGGSLGMGDNALGSPLEVSNANQTAGLASVKIVDDTSNMTPRFISDVPKRARRPGLETGGNLRQRSGEEHSLDHRVAELAADGSMTRSSPRQAQPRISKLAESSGGRLNLLLNTSSVDRSPFPLEPIKQSRYNSPKPPSTDIPPRRKLPFGESTKGKNGHTPVATERRLFTTPRLSTGGPGDVTRLADDTDLTPKASALVPLRQRPISALKLGDFKVNPRFNAGLDYAFSDVVRNKSDRSELAGCTDPNCCGKHFRALAQSELQASGSTVLQRGADIQLLEDYLGDEAHRLGSMSRDEKLELWLEAKTKDLANKFGRHRHRFAPQASPPGFWNADFPNTQEREKAREEAEKIEKKTIEERRREAMRSGGRWLFRDE